jgi:hypothetical protein
MSRRGNQEIGFTMAILLRVPKGCLASLQLTSDRMRKSDGKDRKTHSRDP